MRSPSAEARPVVALAAISVAGVALGLLREASIAFRFGASWDSDAYYVATVPATILLDLGTDLGLALIPLYMTARSFKGSAEAERLFGEVLARTSMIAVAAVLLLAAAATWWLPLLAPGLPATSLDAARVALWIIAPGLCLILPGLIWKARANSHARFAAPAAASLLPNIGIAAGALALAPLLGVKGAVIGYSAGLVVAALLQRFSAGGVGSGGAEATPAPSPEQRRAVYRRFLGAWGLIVVGALMYKLEPLLLRHYASRLGAGEISSLTYAARLANLPNSLFTLALATVAFPALIRLGAESSARFNRAALRLLLGIGAASCVVAVVLVFAGEALIDVIFRHGRFTSADLGRTADNLRYFAIAVVPLGLSILLVRCVCVLRAPWVYAIGGVAALAAYWTTAAHAVTSLGARGLALANLVGNSVMCAVLLVGFAGLTLLRRRRR